VMGFLDVEGATPSAPVLIGVLRPQMARLAGSHSDGALCWLGPASYLHEVVGPAMAAGAASVGRTTPPLVAELPCALTADRDAVHAVNTAAFPTRAEADLVDALRLDPGAWLPGLSYVAEAPDGSVAAYALLTRCRVGDAPALALAPVATVPDRQREGAGQAVVRAVLDAARLRGEQLVLVLGHPGYYPRFGFVPASRYGIRPGFDVPDEAMMALVLDDSMPVPQGMIQYPAAFGV